MLRSSLTTLGVVLLGATALAQKDLSSRVHPITSPVKNAGTLNLATGEWTRAGNGQAFQAGPSIVFSNTCFSGYYGGQITMENWTDEGCIPNQNMLQVASLSIPGAFDNEPGCEDAYNINGFQIGYCTYQAVPFSVTIKFFDAYEQPGTFCAPKPLVATQSFLISGLPSTTAPLTQACWLVGFDLAAGTPPGNFTLTGTDDPLGGGLPMFGWSFVLKGASDPLLPDGPIIAGGVNASGSPFTCSGVDATRWDIRGSASVNWPNNVLPGPVIPAAQEEGSGMCTQDAFRVDGPTTAPSGPGCYYFGGNPTASFHLELYSDVACPGDVGVLYCRPGGICPCGPPTKPHAGCNNGVNTGGAVLTASLTSETEACANLTSEASICQDGSNAPQVHLNMVSAPIGVLAIFFQGATQAGPSLFGNGYLCVGNTIRLNGAPGTVGAHDLTVAGANDGGISYPHAAPHDLSIVNRSAQVGINISPGEKYHYQVAYRDTVGGVGVCPGGGTVNWSNALSITWNP